MAVVRLADYLRRVSRHKFSYGQLDCCTLMADWVVEAGYPDPMSDRRGTYSTYDEYRRAMRSEGGLLESCSRRFIACGLSETIDPTVGDVCVVRVPISLRGRIMEGSAGAVVVADGKKKFKAVITADAGLVIADLLVVKSWRV